MTATVLLPAKKTGLPLLYETGRREYLPFACGIKPGYDPAPHVVHVTNRLEALERGEIDRLILRRHRSLAAPREHPSRSQEDHSRITHA